MSDVILQPLIRSFIAAALLLMLVPPPARAGSVLTADGRIIEGTITFSNGRIQVLPPIGSPEQIDPADALVLTFDHSPQPAGGPHDALPAPWISSDIGKVGLNGKATYHSGAFHVTGAGADIWGTEDSFYYVHQPVSGNIEITARVLSMQNTHEHAKAGIMIREQLTPHSRHVLLLVKPSGEIALERRHPDASSVIQRQRLKLPVWLRLQQRSETWIAQYSENGQDWQTLTTLQMEMKSSQGGLIVLSHDSGRLCTARFDNVLVHGGTGEVIPTATVQRVEHPGGVALRDGRVITGTVRGSNNEIVHLQRPDNTEMRIAVDQVARISLEPLTRQKADQLLDGRNGVLMKNGDFLEGEVTLLPDNRFRVSSILYGLQTIPRDKAAMVVLAPADEPHGKMIVRLADGSILPTDRLRVDGDRLVVQAGESDELKLEARQIHSIESKGDRATSLLAIKPAVSGRGFVAGRPMAIGQSVTGSPLRLGDRPIENGISSAGNTELSFRLDRPYRALICTAGVSAEQSPLLRGELIIVGDGKELYRSPPITSAGPARQIAVPLKGVKTLTLVIRSPGDDKAPAPAGIWADPLLVVE